MTLLGVVTLVPGLTAANKTTATVPKPRDLTVWVSSPAANMHGGGYSSAFLTNIRARTIAKDAPKLRKAIVSLDDLGMLQVKGFGLVPAAVAWQSDLPMRKVIQQQAASGLSYGEILMANSIAAKSGQSFNRVVSLRARSQNWGTVSDQLGVSSDYIVAKANIAARQIIAVDLRTRSRNLREAGTNYTEINTHKLQSHLH
ncbi:MAG TPA: hypothetical protein VGL24_03955 [Chthoniobacterales bacterium]|jgi:hypothetical protein